MLAIASIECGGSLDGPSGVIQSPGFPEGTQNNECHWKIECGFDLDRAEEKICIEEATYLFGFELWKETYYITASASSCSAAAK